ncbi:hypothetical protein ABW19_dt0207807 [Dactylella cylindrospora]|nr:hypothetical protein ABW19_dt0207807 [Dactylella cylindrospora]
MNAASLRPGISELEQTIFIQPLTPERQAELEGELSYFERFLKNETAGDIREYLCIPYSEFWHRTKKIVSLVCTHYTAFHGLERFKKSSFIDELHISRLIDAIAVQDDIRNIIQERQHLKSYIRWLIMNHTRGNHALVNKMARSERRSISLDLDGNPANGSSRSEGTSSRSSSRRQSVYSPDESFAGYRVGDHGVTSRSRRPSGYFPEDYRVGDHGYPEGFEPLHRTTSSSSSFDGTMSPRRQSIRITDILNMDEGEE